MSVLIASIDHFDLVSESRPILGHFLKKKNFCPLEIYKLLRNPERARTNMYFRRVVLPSASFGLKQAYSGNTIDPLEMFF